MNHQLAGANLGTQDMASQSELDRRVASGAVDAEKLQHFVNRHALAVHFDDWRLDFAAARSDAAPIGDHAQGLAREVQVSPKHHLGRVREVAEQLHLFGQRVVVGVAIDDGIHAVDLDALRVRVFAQVARDAERPSQLASDDRLQHFGHHPNLRRVATGDADLGKPGHVAKEVDVHRLGAYLAPERVTDDLRQV